MSKVMILGAGIYQVPLIEKVKELGHTAIVVSPNGPYPGIQLADIYLDIDTRNKVQILEEAKNLAIDAVLTTGTDVAVPTIGFINQALGLNGISYQTSLKSTDKVLMKENLTSKGIKTAPFKTIHSYNELLLAANHIGYPLMVKAVDTSGSRGITKVDTKESLLIAYQNALQVTKSNEVIVEKFLSGYEIGAQAVVSNGEVLDIFIHSDEVTPPPVSVPIGHSIPINLSDELTLKIHLIVKNAIESLGIDNTISNVDIMVVDNEPYIIEISARMGATCLAENISLYAGFNAYEYIIDLALGNEPYLPAHYVRQANAALLLTADVDGILTGIKIPDSITHSPQLVDLQIDVNIGDEISKFRVGPDRLGHIIVKHDSAYKAHELAKQFSEAIDFEVTNEH